MSDVQNQQYFEDSIEESKVDIVLKTTTTDLGPGEDVNQVFGFIDVEKIIILGSQRFYIEKKLPFHVLILRKPILLGDEIITTD